MMPRPTPYPRRASTTRALPSLRSGAGALLLLLLSILGSWTTANAQLGGGAVPEAKTLVKIAAEPVTIAAGGRAEAVITLVIQPGWHINANPPSPDYMIATAVEVGSAHGVQAGKPVYPAPLRLKVGFEESLLSVYDHQAVIRVPLSAGAGAASGRHSLSGSVRFQACNDQVCLAPVEVPVAIAVTVTGGASAPAPGTTQTPPEPSHATIDSTAAASPETSAVVGGAPPPFQRTSAALDNPIARALAAGGWGSFLTLFLIGLALNLTPCVYPMLGVTVSIFGARRAAPPLQVLALALIYVLGMAVMYSSLGLIAAFTGGLFGGLLQNTWVLVGLGALLVALSLSMFGLYELQPPPALLSKLGGNTTTSTLGVFLSGLVVGVFAAPCVGPPVVALLAVVGAKADPWFGFSSFFVLALGLGAPYVLLATFSNALQAMPKSGDWMVWVKKVFGVVLLALGLFYASLALAPGWSVWVAPAALILGGVYLGFFEMSAEKKPRFRMFKRASGALAAIVGVVMVVTTPSKSQGIAFESFSPDTLQNALASGQSAMLDFTASWCAPCHELERLTFTDRRVREKARDFRTFRVDLTRYDSPESERLRREYGITGVPTVLFLTPSGDEVREARVTGFLPPQQFLERMHVASDGGPRAVGE